ncbi:YcaQ family DNA glycosylase [Maribacter sp. MMG018]|uniref:winged helix-turn-helix domain-containing protein n=1 Tax=Maribacter sp. MMG018 TaxID=2822688 RepID=UPI001B363135|nr:crosslink repair DNA glycosylase YcaQ family protein [Maribacter sp. MMG018]MBQ4915487.1 YcaQ family DNA glycosylase [Maribacter sp. MMG018]
MIEKLSISEAQKLLLLSQRVFPVKAKGTSLDRTLATIEHLGYIQIDTISAVQRAHHHTLWNRNPKYQPSHIDELLEQKKVFEYWSHAAAYLPIKDYRFSLPRKQAIFRGDEKHWYEKDKKLMNAVLKRIENEGALMAKDFTHDEKVAEWGSKPAKRALENLYMQGELMVSSRKNFHKVYDLTERVLPNTIDTSTPTQKEYIRFLITNYLKANGIGQDTEIAYLLKNTKRFVTAELKEMCSNNELIQINVNEQLYYALPESLQLLNKRLNRTQLKILSPFDNLLIQRKRMQNLFGFDYQIECYVPEAKRKYGYFVLPILWNGKFVARMDCKAERKTAIFHILHIAFENRFKINDSFNNAFLKELNSFMVFNNCTKIQLHKTTPLLFKEEFQKTFLE